MILDAHQSVWYWHLKSLPEKVREHDDPVRFSIVEREVEDSFCSRTTLLADNIEDADTLLGILFDESLKSKCIAAIDENLVWSPISNIDITIVLVQGGEGCTNIDSDVMDSFAKVFRK